MSDRRMYTSRQRRAMNIIWTASGEYDFQPDFMAFQLDGEPDFYMNSIIGYVRKWYDPDIMEQLFSTIQEGLFKETYDGLLWIALENCAFQRGSASSSCIRRTASGTCPGFLPAG